MTKNFEQTAVELDKQEWIPSNNIGFSHSLAKNPLLLNPTEYNFCRHTNKQHQILIFLSGDCKMVTDYSENILQPGDVCYNPAMSYYGVRILGETPYERVVMHITPNENFDKFAKEIFGESGIINVDIRKHLLPWIERYKEYSKMLPLKLFQDLATNLLSELLYICLMQKNSTAQTVDTAENILKNALGYIDSNWSHIKNIREISNALFISPSYMYEIFNKKLNMAPKTYLMQKRLQAAHAYLTSGIQPNEVSHLVGFNTYTAFYRACKAFYGKTPQEIWIKKNHKKDD